MVRMRTGILAALLVLALGAGAVACSEEEDPSAAPVDLDDEFAIHQVTVTDDGLEPAAVELRVPEKAEIVVMNESSTACAFDFGPYVKALHVPAGETSQIAFIVEDLASMDAGDPEFLAMGCQGGERRGEIRLLTSTAQ